MFLGKKELIKWLKLLGKKYEFARVNKNTLINRLIGEMPQHIWNTLAVFEDSTATLQNTVDVLAGNSVELGNNAENIPFAFQIESLKKGIEFLCEQLKNNTFELSFPMAAKINSIAGSEIEFYRKGESGKLRTRQISVGMDYQPPDPEELPELIKPVFRELNAIRNPFEKAVMTFAAIAKLQMFLNANKRTALLMMNGVLAENGIHPAFFLNEQKSLFLRNLAICYDYSFVDPLAKMIADTIEKYA